MLDLFELATGVRMHARYAQVGGVAEDLPRGFDREARAVVKELRERVDEYEDLIGQQPIFRDRTEGIGVITPEFARQMGLTGPNARASGVDWDLRAHGRYGAYREIDVQPIVLQNGDVYDRYMVRAPRDAAVARHHRAAARRPPERPLDRRRPQGRAAAAPRAAHLDGVADPPLQARHRGLPRAGRRGLRAVEGPRGELGCNLVSDGSAKPWRVHFRSASLVMLQSVAALCNGVLIADLIAILASLDPNMGDCDR